MLDRKAESERASTGTGAAARARASRSDPAMWGNILAGVAEAAKAELSAASARASSSGDGNSNQWANLANAVGNMALDAAHRKVAQMSMPAASARDLHMALTAAKLSSM